VGKNFYANDGAQNLLAFISVNIRESFVLYIFFNGKEKLYVLQKYANRGQL
jgi:hypothetical protein